MFYKKILFMFFYLEMSHLIMLFAVENGFEINSAPFIQKKKKIK